MPDRCVLCNSVCNLNEKFSYWWLDYTFVKTEKLFLDILRLVFIFNNRNTLFCVGLCQVLFHITFFIIHYLQDNNTIWQYTMNMLCPRQSGSFPNINSLLINIYNIYRITTNIRYKFNICLSATATLSVWACSSCIVILYCYPVDCATMSGSFPYNFLYYTLFTG